MAEENEKKATLFGLNVGDIRKGELDASDLVVRETNGHGKTAVDFSNGSEREEREKSATQNSDVVPALVFSDLRYSVEVKKKGQRKKEPLTVLHGVSGVFGARKAGKGEMVCIMGQSGAGKTTLLNVLAHRISGDVSGTILYNGRPLGRREIRRLLGYVHQHDEFYAHLTVRETLRFLAGLVHTDKSDQEQQDLVGDIMSKLGLAHAAEQIVGSPSGIRGESRGISGGERKRLGVAEAMINSPKLIFLDEYTSGLDSESALALTKLLRNLAEQGHTIVATVHQPSSAIYFMFDTLCLLAQGRVVYQGPTQGTIPHFDALGEQYKCPAYSNPPEHFTSLVFEGSETPAGQAQSFAELFKKSKTGQDIESRVAAIIESQTLSPRGPRRPSGAPGLRNSSAPALTQSLSDMPLSVPTLASQFYWLNWRNAKLMYRNPIKTRAKLVITIVLALLLGLIYFDLPQTMTGINDRTFFILNTSILVGVRNSIETLRFFQKEKHVYMRQTEQGLYGAAAYLTSRVLIEAPMFFFFPLVFCAITFPLVGLNLANGENFFIFWGIIILINFNAYGYGLLMGAVILDDDLLQVVAPLIIFPIMLFSGVTAVNIPPGLAWIEYIVYLRYSTMAFFTTEFSGLDFYSNCTEAEFQRKDPVCELTSGDDIIAQYDMDLLSVGESVAVLASLFSVMWVGAYIALRRVAKHGSA